jgi:hypothetical protein
VVADECGAAEVCERGLCAPDLAPRPQCVRSAECPDDLTCVDGHCRAECDADAHCGAGGACQDGFCLSAAEVSPACVFDVDCPAGRVCRNAACVMP